MLRIFPKIIQSLHEQDWVWLGLLLATAITFTLGETGVSDAIRGGAVLLMFTLAGVKGLGVILYFMELRQAPWLWRALMIGWITLVISGILLAWWIGEA